MSGANRNGGFSVLRCLVIVGILFPSMWFVQMGSQRWASERPIQALPITAEQHQQVRPGMSLPELERVYGGRGVEERRHTVLAIDSQHVPWSYWHWHATNGEVYSVMVRRDNMTAIGIARTPDEYLAQKDRP